MAACLHAEKLQLSGQLWADAAPAQCHQATETAGKEGEGFAHQALDKQAVAVPCTSEVAVEHKRYMPEAIACSSSYSLLSAQLQTGFKVLVAIGIVRWCVL